MLLKPRGGKRGGQEVRQSNPPSPPTPTGQLPILPVAATLHTLAPQTLFSYLWESQSGMRPRGDQEKINGCVAMVIAVDSKAYSHVVLKQNKSKSHLNVHVVSTIGPWILGTLRKVGRVRAKFRLSSSVTIVLNHWPLFPFCLLRSLDQCHQGAAPI